uniref:Uncharacterized protein n=1 Tax=Lepeophtheirus salmonis TaxID=72036 RepID=A0A0K2SZU6_LEPSM
MNVNYKGKWYKMSRLGFGLNCAPQIMKSVLAYALLRDKEVAEATDQLGKD